MPAKNFDLHGNAPDASDVALVLIDVINDLEFDGGTALLRHALPMARRIASLKRRAKVAGVPVIYVNDNFGKWRSDFRRLVSHCLSEHVRGRPVVELLAPEPDDYFVLKPKHSAFYHTTLDLLLEYLHVKTIVLTGMATEVCVLFTANDAFMRDLHVVVPSDATASSDPRLHRQALTEMKRVLHAKVVGARAIDFEALRGARLSPRRRSRAKEPATRTRAAR